MPWLVQGTTGRGEGGEGGGVDLGLFGRTPVGEALSRWRMLRVETGMRRAVHSLQVHGREILAHDTDDPGLVITEGYDGHLTRTPGVLLTVSVADCVPISIVAPGRNGSSARVVLLHGGWRGTAAGILQAGLARIGPAAGTPQVHLGPAICGPCYEVGPEVHEALGLTIPDWPAPVDVRAVLARQAIEAGIPPASITVSDHCTRCGDGFFSHRAGSAGRQVGVLGIRP